MRKLLLLVLVIVAACAPVPLDRQVVEEPACPPPSIPTDDGCCPDENGDGVCDAAVREKPEPSEEELPEEEPVRPYYEFSVRFVEGSPPAEITRGEPFDLVVRVESHSNVPLEAGKGHVRWVFANPAVFGFTSLHQFRKDVSQEIAPDGTVVVSWDGLVLPEGYTERSAFNFDVRFCYETFPPHEKCAVVTKLVGIR